MHWVVAWILVGVMLQLASQIYIRALVGGRASDGIAKTLGIRWWSYLVWSVLWPLDLINGIRNRRQFRAAMIQRCPDCGEPWLTHNDHGS